jgi:hypothetical protein
MLSKLEVLNITETIDKAEISCSHLRDELIDHVCCEIEYHLEQGLSFQQAFEIIKPNVGIRDLEIVQENTLLLIDKQYRIMKTTMKIFGVIAPLLMAFGALFKIEHWPWAGYILTLGFFLLTFVFLPSAVYVSYREVSNRKKLFTHLSGFLAAFLFAASFLFKVQHWQWTGIIMLVAAIITGVCFIPSFFIAQIKEATTNTKKTAYIFGLIGSFVYLAGFLFKVNHWNGAAILILSGSVLLIAIAFPLFIYTHYKERETVSSRFVFLTFAVVWFIVPTMLIALNTSRDALGIFTVMESNTAIHLQYLEAKNNKLYNKLLKENNPDSLVLVTNIKQQSTELLNYIQGVKVKIINRTDGAFYNSEFKNNKDIKTLHNPDNGKMAFIVLVDEREAANIKNKLAQYINFITALGIDNISKQMISSVLDTSIPGNTPDFLNSWEEYKVLSSTLITTVNKLSGLQENVLTAEYIAVKSFSRKAFTKQVVAKTL